MRFLTRIFFGVDVALGILIYVFGSIIFGESKFNIWFLGFSLFCVHLPDFDFIPFLFLKKRVRWNGLCGGHWPYGHHPILVLPLSAILAYVILHTAGNYLRITNTTFAIFLAVTAVTVHFVHDSIQPHGLHWFSPFSWTHYTFRHIVPRRIPDEKIRQFYETLNKESEETDSFKREFIARLPQMSFGEKVLVTSAFIVLLIFIVFAHQFS